MDRLTIPDEPIEGGMRREVIDARAVRGQAMTMYWRLKKYEDICSDPERLKLVDGCYLDMCRELTELREQLEQLRKPALAGRAHKEEEQYVEPRYRLDKDSICYGCQHYKAVWELEYEPEPDNVQYDGSCDCKEPCFAGSLNEYGGN